MRVSILIPDEFHNQIKDHLSEWGFLTINDFVLDCIRERQSQLNQGWTAPIAPQIQTPLPEIHAEPSQNQAPEEPKPTKCHECGQEQAGLDGLSIHMANNHGRYYSVSELMLIQQGVREKQKEVVTQEVQQYQQESVSLTGTPCKQCGKDNLGRSTCPHCGFMDL